MRSARQQEKTRALIRELTQTSHALRLRIPHEKRRHGKVGGPKTSPWRPDRRSGLPSTLHYIIDTEKENGWHTDKGRHRWSRETDKVRGVSAFFLLGTWTFINDGRYVRESGSGGT